MEYAEELGERLAEFDDGRTLGTEVRGQKSEIRTQAVVRAHLTTFRRFFVITALLALLGLSGCANLNPDGDNTAETPWNKHQTWENGLPSSMTEGR